MKITIDVRSALVGLVAGLVLMFTLGAAVALPHQVGRYQVTAGGNTGLLIDTVTGQIGPLFFRMVSLEQMQRLRRANNKARTLIDMRDAHERWQA